MSKESLNIIRKDEIVNTCYSKREALITTTLLQKTKQDFDIAPNEQGLQRTILFAGFCGLIIQSLDSIEPSQQAKHYGKILVTACESYMKIVYNLTGKDNKLIYVEEDIANAFKEIDLEDCLNAVIHIGYNQDFAENWLSAPYLSVANKAKLFLSNVLRSKPNEQIGKEIYEIAIKASQLEAITPLTA